MNHQFLFKEGKWLGEGTINLNMVAEELKFYTKWDVSCDPSGIMSCDQQIQVSGLSEIMHNAYELSDLNPTHFTVLLDNPTLGKVFGKGVVTDQMIGWEFKDAEGGLQGFESYEKIDDETYLMHAEYSTPDQFRTVIKGKIWKKKLDTTTH